MGKANYRIEWYSGSAVLLTDLGPWDHYKTITNAAEEVVKEVETVLPGLRIIYLDSEGDLTELLHDGPTFKGYAPISPVQLEALK
jgi:hypothetical protein